VVGGTLNVYSQIGLITLVGLISKHGILIVEFSNQLRQQGQGVTEAVLEAASQRLRPILMTTGAMVLGALPLALASGAGAESRQQIGWVIVGGMSVGTLLTIFVVPTVYTLLARRKVPGEITTPEQADGSSGRRTDAPVAPGATGHETDVRSGRRTAAHRPGRPQPRCPGRGAAPPGRWPGSCCAGCPSPARR
jgi:hypothetical protein